MKAIRDRDHKSSDLKREDFVSGSEQVVDTRIAPRGTHTYDIAGGPRPQGSAWDRGPFEADR